VQDSHLTAPNQGTAHAFAAMVVALPREVATAGTADGLLCAAGWYDSS